MNSWIKQSIWVFMTIICCVPIQAQSSDTIIFESYLKLKKKTFLAWERWELYPNQTYRYTTQYDLMQTEFGKYKMDSNNLKLYSLIDDILNELSFEEAQDSLFQLSTNHISPQRLFFTDETIFDISKNGRVKKRPKVSDPSLCWSFCWLRKPRFRKVYFLGEKFFRKNN